MENFVIPKQLDGMRFNRVRFKEKRAFESGWQNKPYTYDEIQKHFPSENYGIICGKDVRVLDDDTPKKGLIKLYHDNFPETMEVRDHIYFKFDNEYADKIIFESKVLLFPDSNGKLSPHMGECQGKNTYVVGPGSIHPTGAIYELKKDLPIVTISYEKFKEVFGEFFKEKKQKIIRDHKPSSWSGDNISDIPIDNIISFDGLRDVGRGCLQGKHPKHGSDNGMNFRVDTENNVWYCFRCQVGGGPAELIAVMEGICDCHDIAPKCFSVEQGQKLIKIAREKYGLKAPVEQDLGEVKGWAKSISIVKLAKRNEMVKCPKCNNEFKFTDSHGMYWCDTCKYGGGLSKFTKLIIKEISTGNRGLLK